MHRTALIGGLAILAGACSSGNSTHPPPAATAGWDAGTPTFNIPHTSVMQSVGAPDGGTNAWTHLTQGPPLPPPDELITPGNGLSDSFIDAQHDAAGNLWAVSPSNLFLRRAGFTAWEEFGHGDGLYGEPILSVGGGVANTVWVGYQGLGWGDDTDPSSWWYTGGADKVVIQGASLNITHYALVSPPGTYSQYPGGRFKLRRTMRIYPVKIGPFAGDTWFGCNHGAAEVSAAGYVWEHQHPLDCVWDPSINDCATTHEGYVLAVGFYANGNVLFGGSYGIMSLDYNDGQPGGDFWGAQPIHNLSLFDQPLSSDLVDSQDIIGIAAVSDGSIWAASHHSGIAHLHADRKTIDLFQTPQGMPTNDIEDSALDSQGNLWLATQTGVYRINLATGVWQQATGLKNQYTQRIMFERTTKTDYITVVGDQQIAVYDIPGGP